MNDRPEDVAVESEEELEKAEGADDQSRLETLEKVHETLESELNEGAETPPA
jgi:hypothetical protein